MAIDKADGDIWGATLRFQHYGASQRIDAGVCAQFGSRDPYSYRWITSKGLLIPEHASWTPVVINLQGTWDSHGFATNRLISVQECIAPSGRLPVNNAWTKKYAEDLADLGILPGGEHIHRDVYHTVAATPEHGGMNLVADWNNIAYLGPTQPTAAAVASIENVLIIIWSMDNRFYDPDDLQGSNLLELVNGQPYWVRVSQDVYWSW